MVQATGCEVDFQFEPKQYYPMEHSQRLGSVYRQHAQSLGIEFSHELQTLEGLHKGI